jgi:hypothetical protein
MASFTFHLLMYFFLPISTLSSRLSVLFQIMHRTTTHLLNDFLCEQVEKFMAGLSVEDLPGVGWMLRKKLHSHKLYKCSDLLSVSKV